MSVSSFFLSLIGVSATAVDRTEDRQMDKEKRRLEQTKQAQSNDDTNEMHYVRFLRFPNFLI